MSRFISLSSTSNTFGMNLFLSHWNAQCRSCVIYRMDGSEGSQSFSPRVRLLSKSAAKELPVIRSDEGACDGALGSRLKAGRSARLVAGWLCAAKWQGGHRGGGPSRYAGERSDTCRRRASSSSESGSSGIPIWGYSSRARARVARARCPPQGRVSDERSASSSNIGS